MKKMIGYILAVCCAAVLAGSVRDQTMLYYFLFGEENRLYSSIECMARAAEENRTAVQAVAAFCTEMRHG